MKDRNTLWFHQLLKVMENHLSLVELPFDIPDNTGGGNIDEYR